MTTMELYDYMIRSVKIDISNILNKISSLTIQVKPPRSFLTNTSENGWLIHLNLSTLKFCPIVMCVSDRKQMSQFLYNQSEISVDFKISVKGHDWKRSFLSGTEFQRLKVIWTTRSAQSLILLYYINCLSNSYNSSTIFFPHCSRFSWNLG